jgi:hypothetical protein
MYRGPGSHVAGPVIPVDPKMQLWDCEHAQLPDSSITTQGLFLVITQLRHGARHLPGDGTMRPVRPYGSESGLGSTLGFLVAQSPQ